MDLPKGEDARALCLGQGWAAVATSTLMVRLFSIGGVQREMFSLPGAVVGMAGHGEQLLIVYHRGQYNCILVSLFNAIISDSMTLLMLPLGVKGAIV